MLISILQKTQVEKSVGSFCRNNSHENHIISNYTSFKSLPRLSGEEDFWFVRQIYTFIRFHLPCLNTKMATTARIDSLIAIDQNTPDGPQLNVLANI